MKQSRHTYRIIQDQDLDLRTGNPDYIIRVQRRICFGWVDIKAYAAPCHDRDLCDYIMLCARELLDKLQANESL